MVSDGILGRPVTVHGAYSADVLGRGRTPDQWRLDPDLSGGGALIDIGIYPLNTIRFSWGLTRSPLPA